MNPDVSLQLYTPCYGGQAHVVYMRGLLALEAACAEVGLPLGLDVGGGEALIARGRAGALSRFLAGPASHLMFIDADIGFAPGDVFRLIDADQPVIGGVYARKTAGPPARPALELEELDETPSAGLRQVAAIGSGFLLIRRDAAQRISDAHPELRARMGDVTAAQVDWATMVFDSFVDPRTGLYLNDYEAFCRRWRDLAGEVWADPDCRLVHVGQADFKIAD